MLGSLDKKAGSWAKWGLNILPTLQIMSSVFLDVRKMELTTHHVVHNREEYSYVLQKVMDRYALSKALNVQEKSRE